MKGIRSFTEYVQDTFYNRICTEAKSFVRNNASDLDLNIGKLHRFGDVEIDDIKVEHVWIHSLPGTRIGFEVAVSVDLVVYDGNHHYDNDQESLPWLLMKCEGDLAQGLKDFKIFSTEKYNGRGRHKDRLDDALVPVISRENLEQHARFFLEKNYRKALLQPMAIDPIELATGMGLTVKQVRITKDGSIFGQSYFKECETEVYDEQQDKMVNS